MFTGLVELRAVVDQLISLPPGVRLVVRAPDIARDLAIGSSIAVNGCCLTVVQVEGETFGFDAGEETLSRTNLGRLKAGSFVNLERSLRIGDRLGGHFVTGHIDGVGVLDERLDDKDWSKFWFRVPANLTRQMASKGSIAVDGVSLTLVDVEAERFSVALIPHTLNVTTLGPMRAGDPVNLETDVLAKYVEQQLRGESVALESVALDPARLSGPFAKWSVEGNRS
jgi:riboflavin synthase